MVKDDNSKVELKKEFSQKVKTRISHALELCQIFV